MKFPATPACCLAALLGTAPHGRAEEKRPNLVFVRDTIPALIYQICGNPQEKKDLATEDPWKLEQIKRLIETWRESFND